VPSLDRKCIVLAPWCERIVCEEEVKTRTKGDAVPDAKPSGEGEEAGTDEAPKGLTGAAKTLCIPFEQVRLFLLFSLGALVNRAAAMTG
jgi:prolyl-tRNA synthetase